MITTMNESLTGRRLSQLRSQLLSISRSRVINKTSTLRLTSLQTYCPLVQYILNNTMDGIILIAVQDVLSYAIAINAFNYNERVVELIAGLTQLLVDFGHTIPQQWPIVTETNHEFMREWLDRLLITRLSQLTIDDNPVYNTLTAIIETYRRPLNGHITPELIAVAEQPLEESSSSASSGKSLVDQLVDLEEPDVAVWPSDQLSDVSSDPLPPLSNDSQHNLSSSSGSSVDLSPKPSTSSQK
ncbi:uncharacterized protein LOC128957756 [Oppia nitens]|uniref:uncharacterized protein LOC128957756 n=1 Tax=Oppia nitens TaxID=1686743 RepID=UPI0023DA98C0|nr:uncharacterized protein LOC128957756 [Oppia nitens]